MQFAGPNFLVPQLLATSWEHGRLARHSFRATAGPDRRIFASDCGMAPECQKSPIDAAKDVLFHRKQRETLSRILQLAFPANRAIMELVRRSGAGSLKICSGKSAFAKGCGGQGSAATH
jgi:hypothetical protein